MRVRSALVAATVLWGGVFAAHVAGRQEHVHHAPAQARMLTSPLDLSDADLAAGQTTYEARCAGCHGRAGTGGPAPAAGRPAPADLTRSDLRTHTDGEIYWVIANGIPASGMPAATGLSDTARWQLVAWVRNLGGVKVAVRATDGGASYVWDLPPGFPRPKVPADNPMTPAKVELGRYLFYDTRLSVDGTFSCGSCHEQRLAFTDGKALSKGVTGDITPRSSMALHNVAYAPVFTWANPTVRRLEAQALVPMFGEDPVELGLSGLEDQMLARLAAEPRYPAMFAAAFPGDPKPISLASVTRAIASFERTLLSGRSAYDLYRTSADPKALSPDLRRTVLGIVARNADAATWDQLRALAQGEKSSMIRDQYYGLLAAAKDKALARRALDMALTDEPGATNSAGIISGVSREHPDMAFDFAVAHRAQVDTLVDSTSRARYYPGLGGGAADMAMVAKIKAFAEQHIAATSRRDAETVMSGIETRIKLRAQRRPQVDAWLKKQGY